MANVIISTGGIPGDYDTIDTIFAMGGAKEGVFSELDPNKAFDGVKSALADRCRAIGGDAVLFCQFEYRVALAQGLLGSKQALEIFAYGTAVKRK